MDVLSEYGTMDVMLAGIISHSIERELDSVINGPKGHQGTQSLPNRESSSQENEIRYIEKKMGQLGKKVFQSLSIYCLTK